MNPRRKYNKMTKSDTIAVLETNIDLLTNELEGVKRERDTAQLQAIHFKSQFRSFYEFTIMQEQDRNRQNREHFLNIYDGMKVEGRS